MIDPKDTSDCDGYPALAPCTCTRACIPQGITEEQTCRGTCPCGDAGDCGEFCD